MYWNTNDTSGNPSSALRRSSCILPNSELGKWFHLSISDVPPAEPCDDQGGRSRKELRRGKDPTYVLESPYNNAGALTNCFPPLHRLHLNVSWVSHSVSLNSNNCLKSSWVKWRAVSSASSTTHADRFCFWHLESAHPIMNRGGRDVLPLEDLFFYRSCCLESVYETCPLATSKERGGKVRTFLLLTISPYSS